MIIIGKFEYIFLQEKSEAFEAFQKYKAIVENETNLPIKVLWTGNGKEYNSHEFVNFYKTCGIKRQLTVTYIPQQSGVYEKKNHTIIDMVRSLLTRSGLPKDFWL